MSIVIIGGNECMECRYREICKKNGYKAKVFTKEKGAIRKKLGCPDLMVLFTNTVSHKMVNSATQEAKRMEIPILHIHSSSSAALQQGLEEYAANAAMKILMQRFVPF